MSLNNMLRGTGGEFEINRVVGAVGALSYITGANGFLAWEVFVLGKSFDLATYCVAFPTGLGVALGAIAGAVAIKDRNVAAARQTQAAPPLDDKGGQS